MRNIISLSNDKTLKIFDESDGGAFLRTDYTELPALKNLWEKALGLFWTSKMIDFSKDADGFLTLPEIPQTMFLENNGYQSLMDSGVVSIYGHLASLTNYSSVALSYTQIGFSETIHATSYSDGLVQMFGAQATEKIDIVFSNPTIKNRLESELDFSANMIADPSIENIFRVIVATYLLEHIKFPFSFFVTFSINKAYNSSINGFAQLISRIAQEELEIHVPTNAIVIKHMLEVYDLDRSIITEMADVILAQELEWNTYLQRNGPIPGYNEQIGEEFIRYYHNKSLRDIGNTPDVTLKPTEFVNWFNHIRNPDNKQVSQQEMKSTQYKKGVIKNDLGRFNETSNN